MANDKSILSTAVDYASNYFFPPSQDEELEKQIAEAEANDEPPEVIQALIAGDEEKRAVEVSDDGEPKKPATKEEATQNISETIDKFAQGFWSEEALVPELRKVLGSSYTVEQDITDGASGWACFRWPHRRLGNRRCSNDSWPVCR